ncbi:ATP synthase F1 subunit gamma [Brumimicrobium salinarum]|uniref:ATP synthase gamma chain n=1 Tax=Brumimicrobium salinarum TaxID=2058658 RepID=A0A2I0R5V3_9FLAO|nr:ATP synthase F1 subunit gamma [Brumimicrobium salinarum]PKR81957.1 ATP synthase F1 subunit gamma [Brumimicrobium salinarum]
MANLKEIKNRITSISSTMQITQAMKLVSAAKLKRALDAITQLRPYANKIQEILGNVSATLDLSENRYAEQREVKNVLIIGISSNRGLCGGFNNNITKKINELLKGDLAGKNVELLSIGKKVNDSFKNGGILNRPEHLSNEAAIFDDLTFEHVSEYAQYAMDSFIEEKYDQVIVVYNEFKNAAVQIIRDQQLLPIVPSTSEEDSNEIGDYIFEPSKEEIISEIIPKSLKLQLFKAVLDSNASEHGARMTAMHKATDNATELKDDLTLEYNKARQASITNEILEIVGGAEALNG